jgi:hypothetical protein
MEQIRAGEVIEQLLADIDYLTKISDELDAALIRHHNALFLRNGGCPECHGTGYIEVSSDYYTPVQRCTKEGCNEETRKKTGINPTKMCCPHRTKGWYWSCKEHRMIDPIWDKIEAISDIINDLKKSPAKGDVVTVVKGRKVPIGFTGKVIWVGTSSSIRGRRLPDRIGIKDEFGEVQWTSITNVEKMM